MPRLACLCFLLVTAVSVGARAQGVYLPNQQSGLGVAAAVSNNQDATGLSLGVGYSHKAFIDGGVFVSRYGYATSELDVSSIGVQPYVTVHLLRQSDKLSVAGTGSFQKLFFSTSDAAREINGWGFFVGGSAYRHFAINDTLSVTPQATLGYRFAHTSGAVGLFKEKRDNGTFALQLATNLGLRDKGGRIWGFNPYINFDSPYVTFGALLGATFPIGGAK